MNNYAKISIESLSSILGIQDVKRHVRNFAYLKNSDELLYLADPSVSFGDIDTSRSLDQAACKKVKALVYGNSSYEKTLRTSAVKLFVLLNFCITDLTHGVADHVDARELAGILGCNIKTVRASIGTLDQLGYLSSRQQNAFFYRITISGYKSMFKKACSGGKGFFVVTKEGMEDILSLEHINDLRAFFVSLFYSSKNEISQSTIGAVISLKRYLEALPHYVRPCHVRRSLFSLAERFGSFREGYKEFSVELKNAFSAASAIRRMKKSLKTEVRKEMGSFKNIITEINKEMVTNLYLSSDNIRRLLDKGIQVDDTPVRFSSAEEAKKNSFLLIEESERLLDKLADLAVKTSVPLVMQAVTLFYNQYIQKGLKVRSTEALIDTNLKIILSMAI